MSSVVNVDSGKTYIISNVKAGTVIDLSVGDNRTVTGWESNGGINQKWQLNWTGSGWNFRSAFTGTYLGIEGSPANGTKLVASSTPFDWHIWRDTNNTNTFRIYVPNTHENVDLYGHGIATSGNPITLWSNWTNTHQAWNFTAV